MSNILNVVSNYQHVLGDVDDVGKVRTSMLVPVGQVVATFDLKLAKLSRFRHQKNYSANGEFGKYKTKSEVIFYKV